MIQIKEFVNPTNLYFANIFDNIGKPWEVFGKMDEFIRQNISTLREFKEVRKGVYTAEGVEIDRSVGIEGIALIGKNTKIGPATLLRDGVIIGKNCNIGHGSEVKHSIVGNGTNLAHFNYVGDSIIGSNVNLAAGVILANYKDGAKDLEVKVIIDSKKIGTGMKKFGAIIGDGVKLGCNVVTDPGTLIGKNSLVYPLTPLRGSIGANKIVKFKPQLEIASKK